MFAVWRDLPKQALEFLASGQSFVRYVLRDTMHITFSNTRLKLTSLLLHLISNQTRFLPSDKFQLKAKINEPI